jgi:D-lactate dehydrogenase (cytochrome)
MHREHGESVALMRQIKEALDPLNLLNPGKILPS